MSTKFHGLLAGLLLAGASQVHANYTFIDLSTASGSTSSAAAINNLGQVVGTITTGAGTQAALWSGNSLTLLSPLQAGNNTMATGINDAGQIVGINTSSDTSGVIWNGGVPTALAVVPLNGAPNSPSSGAMGINNSGQVVGHSAGPYVSSLPAQWANPSTVTPLSGNCCGAARDINDNGVAVGNATVGSQSHAFLWHGGTATDLGATLAGASVAHAINNAGQVAGASGPGTYLATTWINGTATLLGSLGGNYSQAYAINSAGAMVGTASIKPGSTMFTATAADMRAVIWNGTTATDLNSLLDAATVNAGWVLRSATGINDQGWIVGTAFNTQSGLSHAFLLTTAVPEASTVVMMSMGFIALACARRRRHRAG